MDLITDLDEDFQESEEIQNFISNLNGVDKLWRLTDLAAPNFFTLRDIDKGKISLVDIEKASKPGVIDDIIDEMVEINADFGGDTVFISDGGLEKFKGLALTTRY